MKKTYSYQESSNNLITSFVGDIEIGMDNIISFCLGEKYIKRKYFCHNLLVVRLSYLFYIRINYSMFSISLIGFIWISYLFPPHNYKKYQNMKNQSFGSYNQVTSSFANKFHLKFQKGKKKHLKVHLITCPVLSCLTELL